jgi:prevent-host-death family protein
MKIEVDAYEARTRLPELLREVKAGKRFTITNRGEAVADLIPSEEVARRDPSSAIERFQRFIEANPLKGRPNVRALIAEGRE